MPITTFWSSNKKAIGQSVSAAIAATVMAVEHNYKVLLLSADFNNVTIESCFGEQESNKEIIKTLIKKNQINLDSGINGLLKLSDTNRVTPEIIHDYTKIVFKNRLEILYSPMNVLDREKNIKIMQNLKDIILNASKYYDQVLVDLQKGLSSYEQLEILKVSDVVVSNMDQGTRAIQDFFEIKETKELFNKVIWNICRYDKNSKYNPKNLTRKILNKQKICTVPYNTLLMEAAQEGGVPELVIRLKTLREENNENKLLIENVKELTEEILLKYQDVRRGG